MQQIQPLIRRLLRIYLLAVVIVLLYFLIKTLIPQQSTIPSHEFHKAETTKETRQKKIIVNEGKAEAKQKEKKPEKAFILLPQQ